jgi:hypothetical protein
MEEATSGHGLDVIVSQVDDERRATVAKLIDLLRGTGPDAAKVRACYLVGVLGDLSVADALIANLDLDYSPSSLDDHKITVRLIYGTPCEAALFGFGPAIMDRLVEVVANPESLCQRDRGLWLLYTIANAQAEGHAAAQDEVRIILLRAKAKAESGEATRLESALGALESRRWFGTCARVVHEEGNKEPAHLPVNSLDRTAERLRAAKSPTELDGIMYGVEDERKELIASLLELLETSTSMLAKARACYLLGQFHPQGDQRLIDNAGLEWVGGRVRYPCEEALAKAWPSGPWMVMAALAAEHDPVRRERLVGLMIRWYGGAGAAARLADRMHRLKDLDEVLMLSQALAIAEAYGKRHGE